MSTGAMAAKAMTKSPRAKRSTSKVEEATPAWTHWWAGYLDGLVRRTDGTPDAIVSTAQDWHNGAKSVMFRFSQGIPVKPGRLYTEASIALGENNQGGAEDVRIKALMVWAIRQEAMCQAAVQLAEAATAFSTAAAGIDLDPYDAAQLKAAAFAVKAP